MNRGTSDEFVQSKHWILFNNNSLSFILKHTYIELTPKIIAFLHIDWSSQLKTTFAVHFYEYDF